MFARLQQNLATCLSPLQSKMLSLVFLGLLSRLIPHAPNFTAINAIAVFGVFCLGSLRMSLVTVLSTMLLSDLIFGFHSSLLFVYVSCVLSALLGYGLQARISLLNTTFSLVSSCLLFFFVTNFGVWLLNPLYPKTLLGLELCYVAAFPFLANQVFGTLVYGVVLLFAFAQAELRTASSRLSAFSP